MITLEELDLTNWREAARLEVTATQIGFFPNLLDTIVEAQFFPRSKQFSIRDGERTVGYASFGTEESSGRRKIFRLLVDRRHQGRGVGRDALALILTQLFADKECREIYFCYSPGNEYAAALVGSFGFEESARLPTERNEAGLKIECRLTYEKWLSHRAAAETLEPEILRSRATEAENAAKAPLPEGLANARPKPNCC